MNQCLQYPFPPIIVHLSLVVERSPKPFRLLTCCGRGFFRFRKHLATFKGNPFSSPEASICQSSAKIISKCRVDKRIRKAIEELDAAILFPVQWKARRAEEYIIKLDELNGYRKGWRPILPRYTHRKKGKEDYQYQENKGWEWNYTYCGSLHQKKRQAELYFINLVGTASRVEGAG